MCEKCERLKAGETVRLGRGTLYMDTMSRGEIKEASAIWGFRCIYFIDCTSEPMEYQFIRNCPICGDLLV